MVVFTIPFGFFHNISSILIFLLVLATIYISLKKQEVKHKSFLEVFSIIYFLALVFTLAYTKNVYDGIKQIEKNLVFLLFPLIIYQLNKFYGLQLNNRLFEIFALGNLVALAICTIQAIISYSNGSYPDALLKGSFYFTKTIDLHPTYFSMYLALCLIFSISCAFGKNKSKRALHLLTSIILLISILHLRSRIVIFALFLIALIFIIKSIIGSFYSLNRKWVVLGALAIMFLGFVLSVHYHSLNRYGQDYMKRDFANAMDERAANWEASSLAVSKSFFFGYGIGDHEKIRDEYFFLTGFDIGIDYRYNSHNQILESFLIGGIFTFAGLFLMFAKLFQIYGKTKKDIILYFMVLVFSVMMTESILSRQHGIIFFSLFYTMFNTVRNENVR